MTERAHWKSRFGFVLAAAGSAVGLGNIWKFPYITGENGGGLFVLIYLVCILLVGLPIMMAEIAIGRAAQKQPAGAFEVLQGHRTGWSAVGWLGILTGFVILSYYGVVAGWAMDYTLKSVVNFSAPIHDRAVAEAAAFRAQAPLDEVRRLVIDEVVASRTREKVHQLRRGLRPSVSRDHERFKAALAGASDATEARKRLLSDPALNESVKEFEQLESDIEKEQSESRKLVEQEISALGETELLNRAETIKRRQATFGLVDGAFSQSATDGWTSLLWTGLFMLVTISIVAGGISGGIERACRVLMPTLFILVCLMVIYGAFQPGFRHAFSFVFSPDPSRLKASGVLEALGHAFFTLSLGMGAMITYGSYQSEKKGLLQESGQIVLLDTMISVLACLMIFPIIFSYGQEPAAGPGLVFKSMPLAFAEIGQGGMLLAIMFFGLVVFAALTSAISLLEVVASYLIDQHGWQRHKAAWLTGAAIFVFGIPSAFAMDPNFGMSGWEPSYGLNFFDTMDLLASNWMLTLGGLFTAIYVGWVMPRRLIAAETTDMPGWVVGLWVFMLRIISPALVVIVLLQRVGILDIDELIPF